MKAKKDESRKRTPWDCFSTRTELQEFIIHKYVSTYDFKHPSLAFANEASFVNSIVWYAQVRKLRNMDLRKMASKGITVKNIKVLLLYLQELSLKITRYHYLNG